MHQLEGAKGIRINPVPKNQSCDVISSLPYICNPKIVAKVRWHSGNFQHSQNLFVFAEVSNLILLTLVIVVAYSVLFMLLSRFQIQQLFVAGTIHTYGSDFV